MRQVILHYVIALLVFLAIDLVWLTTIARGFYVAEIGPLLRDRPDFVVAFLFYALFVLGLMAFVIWPALETKQLWPAVGWGAFFGLVAYATYDLTNASVMKGFGLRVAIVDMIWGAVLSGTVTALTLLISRTLKLA